MNVWVAVFYKLQLLFCQNTALRHKDALSSIYWALE